MRTVPGQYTRVGEKKGSLSIGGAEKKIKTDSKFMYLPSYRVAGTEKDVKQWLNEKKETDNLEDKVIRDALKGAYTQSSLEKRSIREAFDDEVRAAEEARADSASTKAKMKQVNLMVIVNLLKKYKEQKRRDPESVKVIAKNNVDLKSKLSSLGEGKVLDVTNMKRKGTETKKVTFKEGGKKKRLAQREGETFYNVVYDPSNRSTASTGVKNFLINYGSIKSEDIDKIVASIKEGETVNVSRAKSPTRSPLVSPRRKKNNVVNEEVDDILDGL